MEGVSINLLRDGDPNPGTDNSLDWPELQNFRCIYLSGEVNKHDTHGLLLLLDRETIQPGKDYFFETYEERTQPQREQLDRVVRETYGDLEVLRNLEYAIVSWTAWGFTFHPYNGIRGLLERMAEAALHRERPWSNIFEPGYREFAAGD